jgi:DNA-binding XRE family transcriptional regulator
MSPSRSWEEIRAQAAREDPGFEKGVAREARRIAFVIGLQGLRKERGALQSELAGKLGMTQANISRIEGEGDVRWSTLAKYADGLGGRLEIHVIFDEDTEVVVHPR